MKRYLIFAALVPLLGGFLLLLATTVTSGYWTETDWAELVKFLAAFAKTLQYSYLFGIVPALIIAAIDDILFHVKRLGWVARILIVGVIAFTAAELLYGSRGPDTGTTQFILYGLVGFIPATISCWWAHLVETPALA
jgi:predicted ribosomally synthesized peptide with SipW-like signal peptide